MASDDNETKPDDSTRPFDADPPRAKSSHPPADASGASPPVTVPSTSRWLALIPVTAALLVFLLMVPRATPPEDLPLPAIDANGLRRVHEDDAARAASAHAQRLPGSVLAIGSALRGLNKAMAASDNEQIDPARRILADAAKALAAQDIATTFDQLKTLRAVQLEQFLIEVKRYEATGTESPELAELGGGFIQRMTDAGWAESTNGRHRILLDEAERAVAFKLVWTALVGGERTPELALALDEQRVLYTLYFTRPHVPDSQRLSYQLMRREAATSDECRNVAAKERLAAEIWRADKVRKLGELDPSYPTSYALGVAYYRGGRYELSMDAFRVWLDAHPDGPLALRARNHWKAAFDANGPG